MAEGMEEVDTTSHSGFFDLDASPLHLAVLAAAHAGVGGLARELGGLIRDLRATDPLKTAATVGGLLVRPELQANCHRLEVLAHLAVRHAQGRRKPSREAMARMFQTLGASQVGGMEDPSEDLFVSLVSSDRGNFRVFGGIAEGAAFFLRAFLGVVDGMPPGGSFDRLRREVYGLLRLSEAVADRVGLRRHVLGEEFPQKRIPPRLLASLSACRRTVTFSDADLFDLGVDRESLRRFAFSPDSRADLDAEALGHTSLERRPLLLTGDGVVLAVPTAISGAIRRHVIEECRKAGAERALHGALVRWYAEFLNHLPVLGGISGAPSAFQGVAGAALASFETRVDAGRWLHVIAFVDDFAGYDDGGLVGINADPERLSAAIQAAVEQARAGASRRPGFRAGMSLVVGCGWGRGLQIAVPRPAEGWRVEVVHAHDLETLSNLPGFNPATLWRTLDMAEELERLGLHLQNVNGLLNLVAWARGLEEHLVPHAQLPEDFLAPDRASIMVIDQNALRAARREAALAVDGHRLPDTEGRWVPVRRLGDPVFAEDAQRSPYAADRDAAHGRLRGAHVTPARTWWVEVTGDGSRRVILKYWEMLLHWLGEAAPVLETTVPGLPDGPIRWMASFQNFEDRLGAIPEPVDPTEFGSMVSAVAAPDAATVSLEVAGRFQAAFHRPDNAAERALLAAFVVATARLGGGELTAREADAVAAQVMRVPEARHIHMLEARTFRQFVAEALPSRHVEITKQDSAHFKLGLGWRARSRDEGAIIQGKAECTSFLNATVGALERDLCASLRDYRKEALIRRVLLNHEAAAADRDWWMTTSSAALALRRDRAGALRTIGRKEAERNAVFLASRVLVEAATCEAPEDGREDIGDVDLARLMVVANGIVQIGGWSDAIRWDAMEPKLQISPLGDILTASKFEDAVLAPFGQASTDVRVEHAAAGYHKNYEPVVPVVEAAFDPAFVAAWRAEFGFSLDRGRAMIDALENLAIERGQAVVETRRSALLRLFEEAGVPPDDASGFVAGLTMHPRTGWKTVPEGYRPRDIEAWRFRRRLSLLRLPLLRLSGDGDSDPRMLVAPGMVREAFIHQARNFHDGDFDRGYASSEAMRSWIGAANDRQGHAFNRVVAGRMRELGWEAECDIKVTRLLGRGFGGRDYGDVDVLAWNRATGRVLLMECKDLQFRKTHGEIAEQISKFRGEIGSNGKPDLLRKHLDRFEVVRTHTDAVKRFTGSAQEPTIECHLVFRNPVPMKFAWDRLAHVAHLHLFRELDGI